MRKFIDIMEATIFEYDEGREMVQPEVLYRSVSIPELISIAFRGRVTGGRNKFNEFEDRPYVFFANQLTPDVIYQGEDHSRYPTHMLRNHPIHAEFRKHVEDIDSAGFMAAHAFKAAIGEMNKRYRAAGQREIPYPKDVEIGLEKGRYEAISKAREYARWDKSLDWALTELRTLLNQRTATEEQYRALHKDAQRTFSDNRSQWPFSSAVLVTKPITGGRIFSKEEGRSQFMTDEIGFHSGDIHVDDIDHVILIKDRKQVETIDPDDILPALSAAGIDTQPYLE